MTNRLGKSSEVLGGTKGPFETVSKVVCFLSHVHCTGEWTEKAELDLARIVVLPQNT